MSEPRHKRLEWSGAGLSMLGALLTALPTSDLRFLGFLCFLVANILLVAWAMLNRCRGISAMQGFFILTSILGIISNFPR